MTNETSFIDVNIHHNTNSVFRNSCFFTREATTGTMSGAPVNDVPDTQAPNLEIRTLATWF